MKHCYNRQIGTLCGRLTFFCTTFTCTHTVANPLPVILDVEKDPADCNCTYK